MMFIYDCYKILVVYLLHVDHGRSVDVMNHLCWLRGLSVCSVSRDSGNGGGYLCRSLLAMAKELGDDTHCEECVESF